MSAGSAATPERARFAQLVACVWEICGVWYIILWLAGLAAISVFGWCYQSSVDNFQHERLLLLLSEIRSKTETDLQLGFDIGEERGVRQMLDNLMRKDASIQSIEIFDAGWISRHSTDLGAIGEPADDEWRRAASRSSAPYWTVQSENDTVLGLPLRGGFQEAVGHLVLVSQKSASQAALAHFDQVRKYLLAAFVVFLLLLLAAPFLVLKGYAQRVAEAESLFLTDDEAVSETVSRILCLRRRLEDAMRKVSRSAR